MLSVVLITPVYIESGTPAGLCAGALAQAFAQHGHDVHVVCSASTPQNPRHRYTGSITVHQVDVRRGAGEHAFVPGAIRCVLELSALGMCDAIECIDAPGSALGLLAMRQAGALDAAVISVLVDPSMHSAPMGRSADDAADVVIEVWAMNAHPTSHHIPLPLQQGVWNPPAIDGPAFIACDATSKDEHQVIADAFEQSQAREQGWSLAMVNRDGCWSILSGAAHAQQERSNRSVLITQSRAAPIAPIHAIWQGEMCIFSEQSTIARDLRHSFEHFQYQASESDSLAQVMRTIANMSDSDYTTGAVSMWQALAISHQSNDMVAGHEQHWQRPPTPIPLQDRAAMWKTLEMHTLTLGHEESSCE